MVCQTVSHTVRILLLYFSRDCKVAGVATKVVTQSEEDDEERLFVSRQLILGKEAKRPILSVKPAKVAMIYLVRDFLTQVDFINYYT